MVERVAAAAREAPWVEVDSLSQVTEDICRPIGGRPTVLWWVGFLLALSVLGVGTAAIGYQIATGATAKPSPRSNKRARRRG